MAKFGALFLNNGVWNGTRLISEDWVQKSIEEYISLPWVSWADGYGYLWWLKTYHSADGEFESFFAEGWGGQKIVVFPGLDMVVAFTGANYMNTPPCDEILTLYILPAVQ
jgi:CubicO group peptidase (beta-lactamase class C family)